MQTKTPIYDFVSEYIQNDMSRLHMPGHKGKNVLGCEERDITEIDGADYLLKSEGIIKESETIASSLFDTACTIYSTEGSTLALKTMLRLAMQYSDSSHFRILAARNVHTGFVHACALLDIDVDWLINEELDYLTSCMIIPERLAAVLKQMEEKPDAVYITSPDYLGNVADIRGLSGVCARFDLPLLVDNAHGAYLHFLERPSHPMDLGAVMCCDSAHKTLPVLTGGAYLHISAHPSLKSSAVSAKLAKEAKNALSVFGTTSPSYLVLQSLDLCNRYIEGGYKKRLDETIRSVEELKIFSAGLGVPVLKTEPLKLVISSRPLGLSGEEAADLLRRHQIECEFADAEFVVLMFTPENRKKDFIRVREALTALSQSKTGAPLVCSQAIRLPVLEKACSLREALFAGSELIPAKDAAGRISAIPTVSCPPAVPIAVSGERLNEEALRLLEIYHIREVSVVKEI